MAPSSSGRGTDSSVRGAVMLLAIETEQGAGLAVIATLVSLLLTFLVTMKRDRRKAENDAVTQWQSIASAAFSQRDAAMTNLNAANVEILNLRVRIRELEIQNITLSKKAGDS